MIYYIVYFLTKFISFLFFPRKVFGWEYIPRTGGFIIACNHASNLDPVVMGISCLRRINFMAKIELFAKEKEPLGFILKELGTFPIKRGGADIGAMKEAIKRLKSGIPVLIFVEGTRRLGNEPPVAQAGVGLIAVKSGVPVIPVYISGTQNVMPTGSKSIKRNLVIVRFAPPVIFDPNQSNAEIAQTILNNIYKIDEDLPKVSELLE